MVSHEARVVLYHTYSLSMTITRAVESVSQVFSSVIELGYCGVAVPPPVVPAANPGAVPTTPTAEQLLTNNAKLARANVGFIIKMSE